jgi:hypothetical protein
MAVKSQPAAGTTLNEACVGAAGADARSVLQLATANATPKAAPAVIEIFISTLYDGPALPDVNVTCGEGEPMCHRNA